MPHWSPGPHGPVGSGSDWLRRRLMSGASSRGLRHGSGSSSGPDQLSFSMSRSAISSVGHRIGSVAPDGIRGTSAGCEPPLGLGYVLSCSAIPATMTDDRTTGCRLLVADSELPILPTESD